MTSARVVKTDAQTSGRGRERGEREFGRGNEREAREREKRLDSRFDMRHH